MDVHGTTNPNKLTLTLTLTLTTEQVDEKGVGHWYNEHGDLILTLSLTPTLALSLTPTLTPTLTLTLTLTLTVTLTLTTKQVDEKGVGHWYNEESMKISYSRPEHTHSPPDDVCVRVKG